MAETRKPRRAPARPPKPRPAKPARPHFPSKADILAFITDHPGKSGKREISRAFGLGAADRIALKRILREMADEGMLEKRGRTLHKAGDLPSVTVLLVTGRDADGEFLAEPMEWNADEQGAAPRIIMVASRQPGAPVAGLGDQVLARLQKTEEDPLTYEARPIRVLGRRRERMIGVVRVTENGNHRLQPVDKKARSEFRLEPGDLGDAKVGDLVSAEPLRGRSMGLPRARVVETLGNLKSEKSVSLIALHTHDIPHVFPESVLEAAEAVKPPKPETREDLRHLDFVTIDPADAKDHDDAVVAAPDDDPDNPDGHVVHVAIADVAAAIAPDSALDREALTRGNSVYFPDRVVPMLPERISNDLCSLRENEDRSTLVVRLVFDKHGEKRGHTFMRAMIRSRAKLAYEDAQSAFDGTPSETAAPFAETVLTPLYAAYKAVAKARATREPLDLELPERRIRLNPDGTVKDVYTPPRLDAHRLIEEFMIQSNVAAAETLEQKRSPLIYRVHDAPSLAKLEALREFLETLNLSIPKSGTLKPMHFNKVLTGVRDTPNAPLVNEVVLRSQSQAEYTTENYGHFGLNLRRYAHFTSPIRRYADLIVHRALVAALDLGDGGLQKSALPKLADISAQISLAERRAMAAERETVDRLIADHLADRIGTVFNARIGGVTRAGLFLRLDDTGADGFVPMRSLDYDYFHVDEAQRAIIGERTGEAFQLGDRVEVKLVEAAPVAGALRFEMMSDGKALNSSGAGRKKGRSGPKPKTRGAGPKARRGAKRRKG